MKTTEYTQQADSFLARFGIKLRATLSNSKVAPWGENDERNHYRVTMSKPGQRVAFDFWGSINDARTNTEPTSYDILACISGDVNCPEGFKDFCSECGYNEDSIQAKQTHTRAARFALRLQGFLTREEQDALSDIR